MKLVLVIFFQSIIISNLFAAEIKANYNDNKVEIYWYQSDSTQIDYFVIESSKNGKYFNETIRVKGRNKNTSYYEVDYHPPTKTGYYRLKQVDILGKHTYSKTIVVRNYNKVGHYGNSKKVLKDYKGHNVLIVLKHKNGNEFYLKADITEYKKELFAIAKDIKLKADTYLIVAAADDVLLNKKVRIIGNRDITESFYTQNKK